MGALFPGFSTLQPITNTHVWKIFPAMNLHLKNIHSQKVVIRNKIMFNKIHDKNQQDDPSGNGTCHQTSQPECNLLTPHGSRKRKQTPVLDLSSDLQKHWHTDTHAQAHVHSHTRTEVWADVNKIDSRYWFLSTIYQIISAFKMLFSNSHRQILAQSRSTVFTLRTFI